MVATTFSGVSAEPLNPQPLISLAPPFQIGKSFAELRTGLSPPYTNGPCSLNAMMTSDPPRMKGCSPNDDSPGKNTNHWEIKAVRGTSVRNRHLAAQVNP